ncbi:ABC-2 family transporter protein-domain-containing protein, partial [Chytriomyces sp. MP71]
MIGKGNVVSPSPTPKVADDERTSSERRARSLAERKPNQLKALSRKTISFQKRQMFTNTCCICLCPLMMVAISALLGKVINDLIAQSQTIEDIQYCSNNNSLNGIGWPIFKASDKGVFGANIPNGKSVNFLSYISFAKLNNNPGAALLGTNKPCVNWLGKSYPQFSPIYERNANLTGIAQVDSTYIPPPNGGWIDQLRHVAADSATLDMASLQRFTGFQQSAWSLVGSEPEITSAVGSLRNGGLLSILNLLSLNATAMGTPSYDPNTGLLGSVEQRVYVNLSVPSRGKSKYEIVGAQLYPYFDTTLQIKTPEELDDAISKKLSQLIQDLASLNKTVLTAGVRKTTADVTLFQINAQAVTSRMPSGGLFFSSLKPEELRLSLVLAVGSDIRVNAAANYPTQGFRTLMLVAQIGQAALRTFGSAIGNVTLEKGTITQGIRAFPFSQSTALVLPFGGLIGRILYPFGVSFLLPIFVIMLVKEKEDRIYIMMKMNGVKAWAYYMTHYLTFFVLFIFSTLIFMIAGRASKLDMFTKTNPVVLVVFFVLWGNVQIVLSFLMATMFSKSRVALVMTFLVVLVGVVISLVLSNLFENGTQPGIINCWPPFAFYRGLNLMNIASYTQGAKSFGIEQFSSGTEFRQICTFLFLEIFVFGALAAYMNA